MSLTSFTQQIVEDFSPQGVLEQGLTNYTPRASQQALVKEIAVHLHEKGNLLAEAETGTGKTLAYLVPALRSDAKILLSTHTKALQDQLMFRDLPAVCQALGVQRRIALLKGRNNYLCPHRLQKHLQQASDRWRKRLLLRVRDFAEKSLDGDLSGLDFDPFEKGIGTAITASSDQCLGNRCLHFDSCPIMQARSRAQKADIVISNHSLLLADAALKAGDFGEVLPQFDVYILDEVHAIPALASQHFGLQLSAQRFISWHNDVQSELDDLGDETALKKELTERVQEALSRYALGALDKLHEQWSDVQCLIQTREERNENLAKLSQRADELADCIIAILQPEAGFVSWQEGKGEQSRHLLAPINTGPVLQQHLWSREAAFICLSATIRVSGRFDYSLQRLGLEHASTGFYRSPFDYKKQAVLYLPAHLPVFQQGNDLSAQLNEMIALLKASKGRAFVLFTSYQALRAMAPKLAEALPWTVLEQGRSGSRDAMIECFRRDTHSVLCGTRSFWEGVDVPGASLSMVIIDKIPFAPPNDVLLQARIKHCEEAGGNGFFDIQLPEAIATLRQGMGRLIRSQSDKGVMALLDSRLYQRRYGSEIVKNLPPARRCKELSFVRDFYAQEESDVEIE